MEQYHYQNYDEYVQAQRRGFEKKKDRVWAQKENIEAISHYLAGINVSSGICHGVRGGQEVNWFRELLHAQVVGTEIGGSTTPHVVEWDFNKRNESWINEFDFVYSNAFDHSYDPRHTLRVWWEQLRARGVLILETDERNEHTGAVSKPVNSVDPTGMTLAELKQLIETITQETAFELKLPVVTYGYRLALVTHKAET